jgi:hypothetical protein
MSCPHLTVLFNAPTVGASNHARTKVLELQTEKICEIQLLVLNVIISSPIGATGLFQPYTTL